MSNDDYGYDDPGEEDDQDFEAEMNCGRSGFGGCSQAGSEHCDWSCPFSELLVNRIRRKRIDPRQRELSAPSPVKAGGETP